MTGENCSTPNAYILFTAFDIFLAFTAFNAFNAFNAFKGGRKSNSPMMNKVDEETITTLPSRGGAFFVVL